MASINNRLKLALLAQKRPQTILSKGFTLVELMVVIVIVGILSSIALPNFLSQQNKAKMTESTSKMSAILKAAHAEYQFGGGDLDAIIAGKEAATKNNAAGRFKYIVANIDGTEKPNDAPLAPENVLVVVADPSQGAAPADYDASLAASSTLTVDGQATQGRVFGCINLLTGKIDIDTSFKVDAAAAMNGAGATAARAALDCI